MAVGKLFHAWWLNHDCAARGVCLLLSMHELHGRKAKGCFGFGREHGFLEAMSTEYFGRHCAWRCTYWPASQLQTGTEGGCHSSNKLRHV